MAVIFATLLAGNLVFATLGLLAARRAASAADRAATWEARFKITNDKLNDLSVCYDKSQEDYWSLKITFDQMRAAHKNEVGRLRADLENGEARYWRLVRRALVNDPKTGRLTKAVNVLEPSSPAGERAKDASAVETEPGKPEADRNARPGRK